MLTSKISGIEIAAMAAAVPANRVSIEEMYQRFGCDAVDKTVGITGVKEVRHSVQKQIASDLGYMAAEHIFQSRENIDRSTIGVLIFVSQTPDYKVPPSALILHKRLNLSKECAAFDINLGCSGFIYGMFVACSMLQNLGCQRALCIVGDTSSKLASHEDRAASLLFGDGTAAILLEKNKSASSIEFTLCSDGTRYSDIVVPYGEFRSKTYTPEELNIGYRHYSYPLMNGVDIFTFGVKDVVFTMKNFLRCINKEISKYDCLVLHQANLYMMEYIAKKMKIDREKLLVSIDRFGNTSGASIPLTLVDSYGEKDGGEIETLLCGFGVGLSWGVISTKISVDNILPLVYSDNYYIDDDINSQAYN